MYWMKIYVRFLSCKNEALDLEIEVIEKKDWFFKYNYYMLNYYK